MWTQFMASLTNLMAGIHTRDEEGQTAVEYALVIALVSFVIVGALATIGTGTFTSFWTSVKSHLTF